MVEGILGTSKLIYTSCPNCLDYQRYLLSQGFDVKQFDQNDIEWINH